MGNLNAPGFVKFWWRNDIVETPYKSIHEIPILGIDKTELTIPRGSPAVGIIHFNQSKRSAELLRQIRSLPDSDIQVFCVPSQNSKEDFATIRSNNPDSWGKMVMNGPRAHPLFKYMKKYCDHFYSHNTNSARASIRDDLGMFVVRFNPQLNEEVIVYYNETKIRDMIAKASQEAPPATHPDK